MHTLRDIARMHDAVGVLTVYVDATPPEPTAAHPPWDERARVELERLLPRSGKMRSALERLEPAVERVLDPRTSGRGRALFAAVGGDQLYEIRLALPLINDVRLGPRAHLLPLMTAVDGARPVGFAAISTKELRLVEVDQGEGGEIERMDVEQPGFERSLRKEPNAGVIENQRRIDRIAAEEVVRVARRCEWEAMVVAGNARVAGPLADAVRGHGLEVSLDTSDPAPDATVSALSALCGRHIDENRRRSEHDLIERVCAGAAAHGRGSLGLAAATRALADGRVDHLLIDAAALPDPDVAGELIEHAFDIDARVTALAPGSPSLLASAEGVGCLLRW
jgi:hypothetical protein